MIAVTQKDIARACNVSRETVTKALQDHPKVSQRTKEMVLEMAEKLGYIPNFYARNLAAKKSGTIGMVVPKISHSFHSSMVELIYSFAAGKGYNVLPMISFEEKENEIRNIQTLLSMQVDGIIANISQNSRDDDIYKALQSRGIPLVFFDRILGDDSFSYVTTDDRKASREIVDYALSKGYRHPAHLAGYSHINIGRERRKGFFDALRRHQIRRNPDWIIEGGFSNELRYENARKLLSSPDRPDLVFCFNDSIALSVYHAAEELNIVIPDELGVIGYGNLALSQLVSPQLSTVELPLEDIARETVRLLFDQMIKKRSRKVEHIVLKPRIIVRESCR